MRALAALMVVIHHATIMVGLRTNAGFPVWYNGQAGVDIFFVISGLVMTLSSEGLMKQARGAWTFLLRRLERVAPLYWIITTVKVGLVCLAPTVSVGGLGGVWHVVASYLFLPTLGPAGYYPVLIVGWTLNFEMMFYVLFAGAIAGRIRLLALLTPVLCLVAALPWMLRGPSRLMVALWNTSLALEFLYGVLLARAVQKRHLAPKGISVALILAGFLLIFATRLGEFRMLTWGLPAAMIVYGAVGLESTVGSRLPVWLLEMGDSSYSLYLTHTLILPGVGALAAKLDAGSAGTIWAWITGGLALSFVIGEVCYRGLELPMMRYFKGRRQTAVPAVAC